MVVSMRGGYHGKKDRPEEKKGLTPGRRWPILPLSAMGAGGTEDRKMNEILSNDGLSALICESTRGFGMWSVALRDDDAEETLPTFRIFDTIEAARAYAAKLVGAEIGGAR
jgi:hypothetical protein